jgi:putative N6-adenine-specific DNA methylase
VHTHFNAFAVTAPGLAALTAEEFLALGIPHGAVTADGVPFRADWRTLALANLWLRTATRVLVRVAEFKALSFRDLEKFARRLDWAAHLTPGQPIQLRVTCRKSRLYHSDAVAERIVGAIEYALGRAPDVRTAAESDDEDEPSTAGDAQPIIVRVAHDVVTISMCSSGVPLYKRGWRQAVAHAPLRETVAAACLVAVNYAGEPFVDPLCGSGTLAIEAALMALKRSFDFVAGRSVVHRDPRVGGGWRHIAHRADHRQ